MKEFARVLPPDHVIDLSGFASAIRALNPPNQSPASRFANHVLTLKAESIAKTDLAEADRALKGLTEMSVLRVVEPAFDDMLGTAITACSDRALILYSRATHTHSKAAGGNVTVRNDFTDYERVAHDRLVNLRDHAIAHYGDGKGDEPWSKTHVTLSFVNEMYRFEYPYRRNNFRDEVLRELLWMVPRAMAVLEGRRKERQNQIMELFMSDGLARYREQFNEALKPRSALFGGNHIFVRGGNGQQIKTTKPIFEI